MGFPYAPRGVSAQWRRGIQRRGGAGPWGLPAVVRRRRETGEEETCVRIREGGAWGAVPTTDVLTNAPTYFSDDEVEVLGLVVLAFRTFGG